MAKKTQSFGKVRFLQFLSIASLQIFCSHPVFPSVLHRVTSNNSRVLGRTGTSRKNPARAEFEPSLARPGSSFSSRAKSRLLHRNGTSRIFSARAEFEPALARLELEFFESSQNSIPALRNIIIRKNNNTNKAQFFFFSYQQWTKSYKFF